MPGASSMAGGETPAGRAGTVSASVASIHARQSGHQDPGFSVAPSIHFWIVSESVLPPVQYWYLPVAGGLTTPAIWPEPLSTKRTGPPKNCEPYNTDCAGAI